MDDSKIIQRLRTNDFSQAQINWIYSLPSNVRFQVLSLEIEPLRTLSQMGVDFKIDTEKTIKLLNKRANNQKEVEKQETATIARRLSFVRWCQREGRDKFNEFRIAPLEAEG